MKKIEAIIQPDKLDAVREALNDFEINLITITKVRGFGRQRGQKAIFPGSEYTTHFSPKFKIELVLNDSDVHAASSLIARRAKTGRIGDGKIFIVPVENLVRIRTGHRGEQAV